MEPSQLVALIRRSWPVLVLAVLLGGFLGHQLASTSNARYEASTKLLVGPINADSDVLRAAGQLAVTYAELARSDTTLTAAAGGLDIQPEDVSITTTASEVTRLLTITVRYTDPDAAAALANALAAQLAVLASGGNASVPAGPEGRIGVIEAATPPPSAVAPNVRSITILGGLAGLVAAAALLLAAEQLSRRIRTATDLAEASGVPVLAVLGAKRPSARGPDAASRLVVSGLPESKTAKSFRTAAASLEMLGSSGAGPRSIVVAGTDPGDDSADIAANIAASLTDLGERVLLAEASLSERGIIRLLGLSAGGLPQDTAPFTTVPLRDGRQLTVIAPFVWSGPGRLDPEMARAVLDELQQQADVVIIHAGQAPSSLATLVWAAVADATVLVARRRSSRRDDVEESAESLRRINAKLVGTFLDERRPPRRRAPWTSARDKASANVARSASSARPPVTSPVRPDGVEAPQ